VKIRQTAGSGNARAARGSLEVEKLGSWAKALFFCRHCEPLKAREAIQKAAS